MGCVLFRYHKGSLESKRSSKETSNFLLLATFSGYSSSVDYPYFSACNEFLCTNPSKNFFLSSLLCGVTPNRLS